MTPFYKWLNWSSETSQQHALRSDTSYGPSSGRIGVSGGTPASLKSPLCLGAMPSSIIDISRRKNELPGGRKICRYYSRCFHTHYLSSLHVSARLLLSASVYRYTSGGEHKTREGWQHFEVAVIDSSSRSFHMKQLSDYTALRSQ